LSASTSTFPLSPVDYVFTGVGSQPITFAFCFPRRMDPQKLKASLSVALESFPIVRSRLERQTDTEYAYVILDDKSILEVVEKTLPFDEGRNIADYITPVTSMEGQPLVHLRLTQTPNGSVLAASLSHALVDGFSYFHFLLSWASLCRGDSFFKPHLDRDALLSGMKPKSGRFTTETVLSDCGLFYRDEKRPSLTGIQDHDRFFLSEETIESHRASFKKEHGFPLSKNDVICALLWQKYIPEWNPKDGNPTTSMTCPFDFRRVKTGLPPNYFGCALCFATASCELDFLEKAPVGKLAALIRNAVDRIKNDFVLNSLGTLEGLRRQDGLSAMERIHLRQPDQGMIVTNLSRMPLRAIDFGFGPPSNFIAHAEVVSSAAILPADSGVEILVAHPLK
jgi:hypothetical protein